MSGTVLYLASRVGNCCNELVLVNDGRLRRVVLIRCSPGYGAKLSLVSTNNHEA
jgi:hypothetical protein